ncbi:MAG: hypothetical protein VX199_04070 [Chloroflexota bacterium]|nr:hypothetical protein [Chloroflexota bacterium]
MAFHFSRDTKVFMKWHATTSGASGDSAMYEIPVLDGFSFSQATNTTEITLSEAADGVNLNSKRGRSMFNDSFAPAEWSFSTYMRPTTSGTGSTPAGDTWNIVAGVGQHAGQGKDFAVEGPLWGAMSATTYALGTGAANTWTAASHEPNEFNFENSNKVALGVFDLYFVLGATYDTDGTYTTAADDSQVTIYKIANCSVGSASIDFDIDGLAQVAWSGQGAIISEVASLPMAAGEGASADGSVKGLVNEGIDSTANFVRQKLTSMTAAYSSANSTGTDGSHPASYALTLTGGNITIENNLSYLTPETLGVVNQPLGHVMGTRTVSGNFTCYLNSVADGSMEMFENLIEGTGQVTNAFALAFAIGGAGQTPRVDVSIPRAHFELPTHSIDDVISLDVNFHGLPADMADPTIDDDESEIKITYVGS